MRATTWRTTPKPARTLGMSTDDLTNNATGAGDAAAEDPEAVG